MFSVGEKFKFRYFDKNVLNYICGKHFNQYNDNTVNQIKKKKFKLIFSVDLKIPTRVFREKKVILKVQKITAARM